MNCSATLSDCAITLTPYLTARFVLPVRARDAFVAQNNLYSCSVSFRADSQATAVSLSARTACIFPAPTG